MKKGWMIIALAMAFCLCMISLASCSARVTREETQTLTNDFLAAITAEDYEKAQSLLHPDLTDDVKSALQGIEDKLNVDFQKGVTIEKYTGLRTSFYDSSIGGSSYELTMRAKIGDVSVELQVAVVRNNNGFGIYSFYVNK